MCPLLLHFGGKNGLFSLNQANRVKGLKIEEKNTLLGLVLHYILSNHICIKNEMIQQ
jgi:hypothetical protein